MYICSQKRAFIGCGSIVVVFYKRQSNLLYQATLSLNVINWLEACTLFFEGDLLQKNFPNFFIAKVAPEYKLRLRKRAVLS